MVNTTFFYSGRGEEGIGLARFDIVPTLEVQVKLFLQGAWDENTGMMRSELIALPSFPKEGYDNYLNVSKLQRQQAPITNRMINAEAASKPVDWVVVELRSDLTTIIASREGILLGDGSVVEVDGTPLTFINVPADEYYVSIRHRNHLAVMSEGKINLK